MQVTPFVLLKIVVNVVWKSDDVAVSGNLAIPISVQILE